MLEKIIETFDPKVQKHDQSRTQTDITPKMTYHSKTKCFSLGPSCIRTGSCQSFWGIRDFKNRIDMVSKKINLKKTTHYMIFIFVGKSETYFPLSLVEPPIVLPTVEPVGA